MSALDLAGEHGIDLCGFPRYCDHSLEVVAGFGAYPAYLRRCWWAPEDGDPVTQLQRYYVRNGRSHTGTATAGSAHFEWLEPELRRLVRGAEITT